MEIVVTAIVASAWSRASSPASASPTISMTVRRGRNVGNREILIPLRMRDDPAMALAQMCKRFCYEDAERFANRHDGGRERDAILEGIMALQRALAEAGLASR
jgi:hypothetical protein